MGRCPICLLWAKFSAADVILFCETMKDGPIDRTIAEKKPGEITIEDVQWTAGRVHSSVRIGDVERLKQWELSFAK